jgi:hypothetical protein
MNESTESHLCWKSIRLRSQPLGRGYVRCSVQESGQMFAMPAVPGFGKGPGPSPLSLFAPKGGKSEAWSLKGKCSSHREVLSSQVRSKCVIEK